MNNYTIVVAVRRFHSLFHSLWSVHVRVIYEYIYSYNACLKGAFHRSLTVLVRYRFPLHIKITKYQYLAFDVSLPPPIYLSCSPKQLDSGC